MNKKVVIMLILLVIPIAIALPDPGHDISSIGPGTAPVGNFIFQNNVSAYLFRGLFELWVAPGISSSYISFNQSHIIFNESYLNATIDARIPSLVTDTNDTIRVAALEASNTSQEARLLSLDTSNTTQSTALSSLRTDNTTQAGLITANLNSITSLDLSNITQSTAIIGLQTDNTTQASEISGKVSKSGDTITGDLTINGILRVIGSYVNLTVTNEYVNGSFMPTYDNLFNLGSPTQRWGTIYTNNFVGNVDWSNLTNKPTNLDIDSTDDLTTGTSFGGDISGQYNSIVILDNSHLLACQNITGATSNLCTLIDTDTWNTTAQIQAALQGTSNLVKSSYKNITDIPTCAGTDKLSFDGTTLSCTSDVDTTTSSGNNYTISIGVDGTTTKTLNLARLGMVNLTAVWTDLDTITTSLPYANITGTPAIPTTFSCDNITGASSNLCTLVDTDTYSSTYNASNITNAPWLLTSPYSSTYNASNITNAPWITTYTDTNDTLIVATLILSNASQQTLIAALQTDNTTQGGLLTTNLNSITSLDLSNTTQATAILGLQTDNTTQSGLINAKALPGTATCVDGTVAQNVTTTTTGTTSQCISLPTLITDTNDTIRVAALELSNTSQEVRLLSLDTSNTTQSTAITALQTDNTTQSGLINLKALTGNCATGQAVMNTTTLGVQCVTLPTLITDTNDTIRVAALEVSNTSQAALINLRVIAGACTDGNVVMNTTTSGVQCVALPTLITDTNDTLVVTTLILSNTSQEARLLSLDTSNTTQSSAISGLQTDNTTQAALINLKQGIITSYPADNITAGTFGNGGNFIFNNPNINITKRFETNVSIQPRGWCTWVNSTGAMITENPCTV